MNDYFALTRHRLDREEAVRKARNAQFAEEAQGDKKARLRWPRFLFISILHRWLPTSHAQSASLPCPETPLSAH